MSVELDDVIRDAVLAASSAFDELGDIPLTLTVGIDKEGLQFPFMVQYHDEPTKIQYCRLAHLVLSAMEAVAYYIVDATHIVILADGEAFEGSVHDHDDSELAVTIIACTRSLKAFRWFHIETLESGKRVLRDPPGEVLGTAGRFTEFLDDPLRPGTAKLLLRRLGLEVVPFEVERPVAEA